MNTNEILEELFKEADALRKDPTKIKLSEVERANIDILITHIDKNKSLFSALITSLLKKIISPKQDIRLHRADFKGGYSARSLDTDFTNIFLNKYFPKYANTGTGFLTVATRERTKWTLKEGQNIKTRNKLVKKSFLETLDFVQTKNTRAEFYLIYIFLNLIELSKKDYKLFEETIKDSKFKDIININVVLAMLEDHLKEKQGSRLPVIAIYSVYQELLENVKVYKDKKLLKLNAHTASDKHGFGDVEIYNKNNTPFEIVEIKHNISIDKDLIFNVEKKAQKSSIKRYYILTTNKKNFISEDEEKHINQLILKIKKDSGLDIIANGIITSLKYYLRFVPDLNKFIQTYTKNLVEDAKNSTEIKDFHVRKWDKILKSHKIQFTI